MPEKPTYAGEYTREHVELVKSTCLYVATKLGDYMNDIVIVGGIVPSLLIDQDSLPEGTDRHVGTMDLDIGLALAIFDNQRYQAITDRLRSSGFTHDVNEQGRPTRQRWIIGQTRKVTIDFLIPPSTEGDEGGKIKDIEKDFAAVITPGLKLAFLDRQKIELSGETIFREKAQRPIWVCGPGAFVVLKALAFRLRGENKDAYDLYYHLRDYGDGVHEIANAMEKLINAAETKQAIEILKQDFTDFESVGPIRVAEFISGGRDDGIQADVVAFVNELLRFLEFHQKYPNDSGHKMADTESIMQQITIP
jgi:hypothetical protein